MRRMAAGLAVVALTVTIGGAAGAQACMGMPSFDSSAAHVGASAAVANVISRPRHAYALDVTMGREHGAFGGVAAALEDGTRNAWTARVDAGLQSLLPTRSGFELCPVASASSQWWQPSNGGYYMPPDTTVYHISAHETVQRYSLGLSAGARLPLSDAISAIPFVGVAWIGRNAHVSYSGNGATGQQNQRFTDSFGNLRLGAGIGFAPRLTVRAHVDLPFSVKGAPNESLFDSKIAYGFGVVLALGR